MILPFSFPFKPLAPAGLVCRISDPWEDKRRHSRHDMQRVPAKEEPLIPAGWINLQLIKRPRFIQPGEQRFNYR
jgi:hypothetical protein